MTLIIFQGLILGELDLTSEDFMLDEVDGLYQFNVWIQNKLFK